MIYLTRRATFSASHYYWNPAWSAEKNQQVFGRCANRNGHGHNYTFEVTVAGEPDSVTGFVVDLKWLKDVMERDLISVYRYRERLRAMFQASPQSSFGCGKDALAICIVSHFHVLQLWLGPFCEAGNLIAGAPRSRRQSLE